MKCPLIKDGEYHDGKEWQAIMADCLKEECAWWDSLDNQCILYSHETNLLHIGKMLQDIRDKIPHSGQFKR